VLTFESSRKQWLAPEVSARVEPAATHPAGSSLQDKLLPRGVRAGRRLLPFVLGRKSRDAQLN